MHLCTCRGEYWREERSAAALRRAEQSALREMIACEIFPVFGAAMFNTALVRFPLRDRKHRHGSILGQSTPIYCNTHFSLIFSLAVQVLEMA